MTNQNDRPPIFVTGIHRSGTHWVGKMISYGDSFLVKDEEIFNCEDNITQTPIKQMYLHISNSNAHMYLPFVQNILENKYSFSGGLRRSERIKDILRVGKRKARSLFRRLIFPSRRLLIVEPIGLLSAPWFARTFNASMVIMIRHPASFVSSIKRYNWTFDFGHLTKQSIMQEELFGDLAGELQSPPPKSDLVGQGILVWKLMYTVVYRYQQMYPKWIFLRQEDLAAHPHDEFRKLYDRLNLTFSEKTQNAIMRYSSDSNPIERPLQKNEDNKRNSKETINIWKRRLLPEEIARVRKGVQSVSKFWYPLEDWY